MQILFGGEFKMELLRLETDRLILRKFEERDMEALYLFLKDEEVNIFLPWFPVMISDMCSAGNSGTEELLPRREKSLSGS